MVLTGFVPGVVSKTECRGTVRVCAKPREPWPAARFVRDFVFFTPLGDLLMPKPETPSSGEARGTVLVTGATGGVGKRVVKELLKKGYNVKVLARTKLRAQVALGDDVDKTTLYVSDLYNLREEMFEDAQAVISCTGVKVGPTDDTPDRSKYYQGLTFYPPEILEDTPENVEYKGLQKMAELAKLLKTSKVWLDFTDKEAVKRTWGTVDDIVMGGVSESTLRVENAVGVFSGLVSAANNGGFASVRTRPFPEPLSIPNNAAGMALRVKGDGNRYKIILRDNTGWDSVGFSYSFDTVKGEWIDVRVPFDKLRAVFRAKTVADKMQTSSIRSIQLMLSKFEYDGGLNPYFKEGVFELQISSIGFYTNAPKLIHVSSAGVTRVLRQDEFPDLENQPPAVRMNAMLGRILEWKLAGEDVIRESGVPYLIVRPCALTEKAPVRSLTYSQGDTMTGQVSRDDIAKMLVDAMERGGRYNVTVEVKEEGNVKQYGPDLRALKPDDEKNRKFAAFPYVPAESVPEPESAPQPDSERTET